jgi:uncharacterized protein YdaL
MIPKKILPLLLLLAFSPLISAQNSNKTNSLIKSKSNPTNSLNEKKVLIVTDATGDLKSLGTIETRQLRNLLGHFKTSVKTLDLTQYSSHTIDKYDVIFFVGLQDKNPSLITFINDVWQTKKTVIWLNKEITEFENNKDIKNHYGFSVLQLDSSKSYHEVNSDGKLFTREAGNLYILQITNKRKVDVLASAKSELLGKETPYIIRSGNFYYIADIPFDNATETDRYLLFADLLHEMVSESHPECHQAIVRIEDVTPLRDPVSLYNIADILSSRNIPFLIGVVPFYVNPEDNTHISLSDRPKLVEALTYCVKKGATIVLHGVTHQYKGISALDYEFWDADTNRPIKDEKPQEIEHKIERGINECVKNGIYPLIWETPHYAASIETYKIISKYFSTSIERRLVANDSDDGQFFPYLINKDIYGQKVYPETLGYLETFDQKDSTESAIQEIINNAKAVFQVRDGYASFYFHTHLDPDYLKQIVDSIINLGFSFVDLRQGINWVKTKDRIILSGPQSYTINLNNSYLNEIYFNQKGEIEKRVLSGDKFNGTIAKMVKLKPGEFYMAAPMKNTPNEFTFKDKNHGILVKNHGTKTNITRLD